MAQHAFLRTFMEIDAGEKKLISNEDLRAYAERKDLGSAFVEVSLLQHLVLGILRD